MGKKLAEAEARAKQDAAAHEKRVAQLQEELRDVRRYLTLSLIPILILISVHGLDHKSDRDFM